MITVNLRIKVQYQECSKALDLIKKAIGKIQSAKGLISCKAYRDIEDADSLVMIQQWESGEEMESYIRSSKYRSVQELLELSIEQPKVSFDMVSWTLGKKYLNVVRG